jgi:acetate---CoA ligase (ADP-forming)
MTGQSRRAGESPLASMLEARSVAVLGASARPGSFGEQMMVQLVRGGFAGVIHPVNPRYSELMGLRCVSSIAELSEPVDLAILGVANERLEEQLRAAATAGARSAVIFASCYEEPIQGTAPLSQRLVAIAREADMAVCGGNGMGFMNFERGLRACGFSEPEDLEPGPIAFITHSGSVFSAMLHNHRGLRFNVAISSGLEIVTTATEYMEYALELSSTRAVALFLETVRDPSRFRSALTRAAERDVPVVVLKVGAAERARESVVAHSGALAGEDGAYEAVFDAHGVVRVETLDEMCDSLELLVAGRRAAPGGLAAIHDSGGERAHLIDVAERMEVRLTRISDATRDRVASVLEPGLPAENPLDAWGTGHQADEIFIACMLALLDDPDTGALAFCVDLTTDRVPDSGYKRVANEVFAATDKPMAVLSNMASAIDRRDAAFVRGAGIPVLEGTATGLAAFQHLFEYRDFRARAPLCPSPGSPPGTRERWAARLASGSPLSEVEGLALLSDYAIPVVAAEEAEGRDEVTAAAERLGWPVVMKTAAADVHHKSDARAVHLGLRTADEVRRAYDDVAGRLGPRVVIEAQAPPGQEFALGIVRDEQFGPLVMVAAGGVLIELLDDRRFALPPLDETRAHDLIDRLSVRTAAFEPSRLGGRGLEALAGATVRLSVLAEELGDHLEALDVNPIVVGPWGCLAVDALVIPGSS